MAMSYETVTKLIEQNGGLGNIKYLINDAGYIIYLQNINGKEITVDKDLNVITYPAIDSWGDYVQHSLSLDSLAQITFDLPDKPTSEPKQSYVPGFDDRSNIEYTPEYLKELEQQNEKNQKKIR